jgi:hypothetical protein
MIGRWVFLESSLTQSQNLKARNERKERVMMNYKLMIIICSGLFLGCVGCKTTANQSAESQPTASQPTASQPAANQPAAVHIMSKRVYDTSYIPRSLYSKVNPNGDGYINKPFVVKELLIDGKCIYEVTNNGAPNYYDDGGTELAGVERESILTQVKATSGAH